MINKRGQTFLVIALVVVALIIGLSTIYTKTKSPKEESRILDLSDEIYYEGAQVVDRGVFTGQEGTINQQISLLIEKYSQLNPDSQITVLYGDATGATYYCENSGSVGVRGATQPLCALKSEPLEEKDVTKTDTSIQVALGEESYSFDLQEGQNFFVVIKKETAGGEQIVAT